MILQELFAGHPFIAWSLVAFVAAELVAAGVIVVRLFRKTGKRRSHRSQPPHLPTQG